MKFIIQDDSLSQESFVGQSKFFFIISFYNHRYRKKALYLKNRKLKMEKKNDKIDVILICDRQKIIYSLNDRFISIFLLLLIIIKK